MTLARKLAHFRYLRGSATSFRSHARVAHLTASVPGGPDTVVGAVVRSRPQYCASSDPARKVATFLHTVFWQESAIKCRSDAHLAHLTVFSIFERLDLDPQLGFERPGEKSGYFLREKCHIDVAGACSRGSKCCSILNMV